MKMTSQHSILVVNPGSTSTKMALSADGVIKERETIHHGTETLKQFHGVWDQFGYRLTMCKDWAGRRAEKYDCVVALGGLLKPVTGGVYAVNKTMIADARANIQGEHASNLGCALAQALGERYGVPAMIVDPVSVDEFEPLAYYSGHPSIKRRSLSHALSIHAAAERAATELGIPLKASSFVIAHIGGGISVAPVRGGKIIDANDAASDGPFSPERSGGLPLQPFISLCFSGKFNENKLRSMVMGNGGLVAYLGTNSITEVEQWIAGGNALARETYEAMAYQVAKEIGAMATVLGGDVHAVILTGGVTHSTMFTGWIENRIRFIAPVILYPGEDEMQALANGALRILRGEQQLLEY